MRKYFAILAVMLTGAFITGGVLADGSMAGAPRLTSLRGAEEAPVVGDPAASGFAIITLNVGKGRVCWTLTWSNINPAPFATHIHVAQVGVAGPIVVPLGLGMAPGISGTSSGCRTGVDPTLVQAIIDFPDQYYVNIHNPPFPGGAIRGQLSVPGQAD